MKQAMERWFITGGTGYLGQALVRQLTQRGYPVGATFFSTPPPKNTPTAPVLRWYAVDIRDREALLTAFTDFRPTVVIHTACRHDGPELQAVTTTGARLVAEVAQQMGVRFLHLSSDVIFSGTLGRPYTESDLPDPVTAYGRAKAEAEYQVLAVHPQATIIRTSLIYGFDPLDRHSRFILEIADGKRSDRLFHDEYRCPIMVDDLVAALLELATLPYHGVLNIAGGERVSRYEFGVLLATWHGRNPDRIGQTSVHTFPTPRPRDCALDIRMAQRMLKTPLRGVGSVLADEVRPPSPQRVPSDSDI